MSWLSDSTELVPGGWLSSAYPGHGILGANVPSTGTHGAGLIFRAATLPDDNAVELRLRLQEVPAGLTAFDLDESGGIYATGPNGLFEGGVASLFADGALREVFGFSIQIGTSGGGGGGGDDGGSGSGSGGVKTRFFIALLRSMT